MKNLFTILIITFCLQSTFAQFPSGRYIQIGLNYGMHQLNPGYYKMNSNVSAVSTTYNDRFTFLHSDFRSAGPWANGYMIADGSFVPDALFELVMIIAGKKEEDLNRGKLRKIQENVGGEGYGEDYCIVQWAPMAAIGNNGLYLGPDLDFSNIATHTSNGGVVSWNKLYCGLGLASTYVQDKYKGVVRADYLFSSFKPVVGGLGITFSGDYAINKFLYAGLYYKLRKFNNKETEAVLPKPMVNSIGVRMGFMFNY